LSKQEKKEARKAGLVANFQFLDTLIQSKNFVIEATFLENKYGERIFVAPGLNFIRVDSTNGVLQTGSYNGMSSNGVGGVTVEGRVSRWRVVKNFKSLSYYIQFSVESNTGVYDVSITLTADNNAQATITGNTSGKLIYDGHLEAFNNSSVYKGRTSY
jgi:hypothetical protein